MQPNEISVTRFEVEDIARYLRATLNQANRIRSNAPAGSYLDSVLSRTIEGLELELAQLRFLLADPEFPSAAKEDQRITRMRRAN
ncbi:hypothetical protein [Pannonibacter carbonis]|uniref:hypothetical protein n=1 Tax=Pannonibacter carbonis TaxID=2067569 RepID=UPI000D0FE8A5|nr:hypothetical protein [Pannonibacter carbonis]